MRIVVLLTCHNRRESTLQCLQRVQAQGLEELSVVVADAGSSDGTADAVTERWPEVVVLRLADDLFWNGGMLAAWQRAGEFADVDAYLWLNDDTLLDADALRRLLEVYSRLQREEARPAIVVGSARDPISGELTYGGVRRPQASRPLHHVTVAPTDVPQECETMNGNIVLVPRAVVDRVGLLDANFTHGMGDFDYGHRARRAGCVVIVAPGTYATCARNEQDSGPRGVRDAWHRMSGPKHLPPREWMVFARRWAGPVWPVYALSPYIRRLTRAIIPLRR